MDRHISNELAKQIHKAKYTGVKFLDQFMLNLLCGGPSFLMCDQLMPRATGWNFNILLHKGNNDRIIGHQQFMRMKFTVPSTSRTDSGSPIRVFCLS